MTFCKTLAMKSNNRWTVSAVAETDAHTGYTRYYVAVCPIESSLVWSYNPAAKTTWHRKFKQISEDFGL